MLGINKYNINIRSPQFSPEYGGDCTAPSAILHVSIHIYISYNNV